MKPVQTILPPVLVLFAVIIQSTLLSRIAFWGVTPDIALILVVFFANRFGSLRGQINGFIGGIVEDFVSLSPLGFHAFIKTLTGFLYGLTKGNIFLDPVFMPLLLTAVATLLKHLLGGLLGLIFVAPGLMDPVFTAKLGIEIGINALISPFLFGFLKIFKIFKRVKKNEFI